MSKGYEYDIFLSYKRNYPEEDWVKNHFYEKLHWWLHSRGLFKPRIFIDKGIKVGTDWQKEIEHALKTSKCLVAIWSPPYFYSKNCLTELQTMIKREELLGLRTDKKRQGLICPVIFNDGDRFPQQYMKIQYFDMHTVNIPEKVFEMDVKYVKFIEEVQKLCEQLLPMIENAPPWSSKWPIVYGKPGRRPNDPFPRI